MSLLLRLYFARARPGIWAKWFVGSPDGRGAEMPRHGKASLFETRSAQERVLARFSISTGAAVSRLHVPGSLRQRAYPNVWLLDCAVPPAPA